MSVDVISRPPEAGQSEDAPATHLLISGMTCSNCARHVREALESVPGVSNVDVSLDNSEAAVRWTGEEPDVPALVAAVEQEGYGATLRSLDKPKLNRGLLTSWQFTMLLALGGTLPIMLGEWLFQLGSVGWFRWLSFFLAAVVQAIAGARFYRGAWTQLKTGSSNMDTLVALGSSTAFLFSSWALFTDSHAHLFFMEGGAIIALVSAGHWLEARATKQASSAVRQLSQLAPPVALRRFPDGTEKEIPVSELKLNYLVVLRPGNRIPADGRIVEGASAVDESMLTGESVPVEKKSGDSMFAGTWNLNGQVLMQVTALGNATALAKIIAAVQHAQNSRAHIQRIGDRVSNVFVPVVVVIALIAFLVWALMPELAHRSHAWVGALLWPAHPPEGRWAAGFIIAAAVLIVACPCAMGLATPAAIMAGSNAGARLGILIRDGVALEKAGTITAVLFDKTGTLTSGKAEVLHSWRSPAAESSVLNLAAALAAGSTHPLSRAIAALQSDAQKNQFASWQEIPGAGIQATHQGRTFKLGALRWLAQANRLSLAAESEAFVNEWNSQGASIVALADSTQLLALFAVRDTLKPGAQAAVAKIQSLGLKTYLVTGDTALTASAIAKEIGIPPERVFSEIRPEGKAGLIKTLQGKGERIAFVGDGLNDAPALEQADLGIAVSKASDIAREAADIILLKADIEAVPQSLGLARATLRTIKQNLFWAFFYNALGIPLAALGFMNPMLCAAAMGLSDLVVIGNALRLKRWR